MTLEERFKRNNQEDQIYIGDLIESHTSGEFGTLLRCIIEGLKSEIVVESSNNNSSRLPADNYLGRLQSLNSLQERLDYCIEIKNRLTEEKKEESQV